MHYKACVYKNVNKHIKFCWGLVLVYTILFHETEFAHLLCRNDPKFILNINTFSFFSYLVFLSSQIKVNFKAREPSSELYSLNKTDMIVPFDICKHQIIKLVNKQVWNCL